MPGPLHGLRILEIANVVVGPWACQILGDMGADVIKIEAPKGDSIRTLGPHRSPDMAAIFLGCNRNKRSLVLDLKKKSAREALLKLAATADVVIHNNRPQAMTKLGLDYAAFKAVNPRIIYCGAYGYSKHGPYGQRGALDDAMQAASGVAALNKAIFGEPRFTPTLICDKTTALAVVYGVLGALFHRERTGRGQELEVPMFETVVGWLMVEHLWGEAFSPARGPLGYGGVLSPNRRPFPTKDGYIAILTYMHWDAFCKITDNPALAVDPRFSTLAARIKNIDAVYAETGRIMATRTTAEWLKVFESTSMPVTVVNSLDDLLVDPHLTAAGFWRTMDHPTEGKLRAPAFPVNFFGTPADDLRPPPRLGEHSAEILRTVGLTVGDV